MPASMRQLCVHSTMDTAAAVARTGAVGQIAAGAVLGVAAGARVVYGFRVWRG